MRFVTECELLRPVLYMDIATVDAALASRCCATAELSSCACHVMYVHACEPNGRNMAHVDYAKPARLNCGRRTMGAADALSCAPVRTTPARWMGRMTLGAASSSADFGMRSDSPRDSSNCAHRHCWWLFSGGLCGNSHFNKMVSHLSKELCFARQIGANSPLSTGGGASGHKSWLLVLFSCCYSSTGKESRRASN